MYFWEANSIELGVRREELTQAIISGERLRFGGSTSASTAGVLACQWKNDPKKSRFEFSSSVLSYINLY